MCGGRVVYIYIPILYFVVVKYTSVNTYTVTYARTHYIRGRNNMVIAPDFQGPFAACNIHRIRRVGFGRFVMHNKIYEWATINFVKIGYSCIGIYIYLCINRIQALVFTMNTSQSEIRIIYHWSYNEMY